MLKELCRPVVLRTTTRLVASLAILMTASAGWCAEFGKQRILVGHKGPQVVIARCMLEAHGFARAKNRNRDVFGGTMLTAVKKLQTRHGLTPAVGNIGPKTFGALRANAAVWNRCVGLGGATGRTSSCERSPAINEALDRVRLPNGLRELCEDQFRNVLKLQVIMDRGGFSSGEIDGVWGSNTVKAFDDWRIHKSGGNLDLTVADVEAVLDELLSQSGGSETRKHVLTARDVGGPYLESIPADPAFIAKLDHLSYTSVLEKLGEKFQVSVRALKFLNPKKRFVAGETIEVPRLGPPRQKPKGELLLVLQRGREVLTLYAQGKVVARYPVTINPERTPTGTMYTQLRANRPQYTYTDPETRKRFQYQPGPNNVIGTEWIALNKPGFGIHGSSNPANISKNSSSGCIRMVNWDIEELGPWIAEGVTLLPID